MLVQDLGLGCALLLSWHLTTTQSWESLCERRSALGTRPVWCGNSTSFDRGYGRDSFSDAAVVGTPREDTNGLERKSAAEVLQDAAAALKGASSVRMSGTGLSGSDRAELDVKIQGSASSGTLTVQGARTDAIERFSVDDLASQLTDLESPLRPEVEQTTHGDQKAVVVSQQDGTRLYVANTGTPYPLRGFDGLGAQLARLILGSGWTHILQKRLPTHLDRTTGRAADHCPTWRHLLAAFRPSHHR